jgi:hypothetical protein
MNHKLSRILVIGILASVLFTLAWPTAAQQPALAQQSTLPQRQPAELRDAIGFGTRAPEALRQPNVQPSTVDRVTGSNPGPWTRAVYATYRTSTWEIYGAQGDGSNTVALTNNSYLDTTPNIKRGGTRVAFISTRDGNAEVYVMNANGSGQTRLTNTSANEYLPAWSLDGSKIAFYSYRDGNAEIYVMNADGSAQTRLTNNGAWDGHPAWSPDGTQIVFSSQRNGGYDLFKMSAQGANQTRLTSGAPLAFYPNWSPDGSTIIFNYDANGDSFLDIATVSANGGSYTPLSYAPAQTDELEPKWDPTGHYFAYAGVSWVNQQGMWYWTTAYVRARPIGGGPSWGIGNTDADWYPDWKTADTVAPASQVSALPQWTPGTAVLVDWSGTDTSANGDPSGLVSYDVQLRDGINGVWMSWLVNTPQTNAVFNGTLGHTYYFRSRARDYATNLEAYPGGNGDTSTTFYQSVITGQIRDNRDRPLAVAQIQTEPAALNTSVSRHDGTYDLYFAVSGGFSLTTTRSNYGALPPLFNGSPNPALPTLYLPPLDNQIDDSHFESGDLIAWNPIGDLTPTITSTAHTGSYAVLLGGDVPAATVGPWHSTIEQTIAVTDTIVSGTLSLVYDVKGGNPLSETLTAYLIGLTDTLTLTLPFTATSWTHAWFDVSTWSEPTATLQIDLLVTGSPHQAEVVLDEVTWGSLGPPSSSIFLPMVRR